MAGWVYNAWHGELQHVPPPAEFFWDQTDLSVLQTANTQFNTTQLTPSTRIVTKNNVNSTKDIIAIHEKNKNAIQQTT